MSKPKTKTILKNIRSVSYDVLIANHMTTIGSSFTRKSALKKFNKGGGRIIQIL